LLLLLFDVLSPLICWQRRNGNSSSGRNILQHKQAKQHQLSVVSTGTW
jgi:hypothetical protein